MAAGDESFETMFRAEMPSVVSTVYRITNDLGLAEDVAQEAFAKALARWRRIRRYDRPGAWVRRVAIRDAVRAASRAQRTRPLNAEHVAVAVDGDALDPELLAALRSLPAQQRAAVALYYLEDRPASESRRASDARSRPFDRICGVLAVTWPPRWETWTTKERCTMSLTERLDALDGRVDVDLDGSLGEVRRRAGRRQRLRVGVASCAAALLVVVGVGVTLLVVDGEDDARVDTVDTETIGDLDALAERLLEDEDVAAVAPDLGLRAGSLTGMSYDEVPIAAFEGFTRNAIAGVQRRWSEQDVLAEDGEPRQVTSAVFAYSSDTEAGAAADEVLTLLAPTASDVGDASLRAKMVSFDGGDSEGLAVATEGPLLLLVRVEFIGQGDPLVVEELAKALER